MECDYPSAKRARFCSSDMEQPRSCHMAAAATHMPSDFGGKPVGEVEMQDASFAQLDTAQHSDQHSRRKTAMPILERFFLGLLTERDLYDRGIRLTQEQLNFYRRLKGSYY